VQQAVELMYLVAVAWVVPVAAAAAAVTAAYITCVVYCLSC
jgi:hypothetical protein